MNRQELALATEDLAVSFGGVRAVDAVSITVMPGELVALIGPNGAGKTSFVDAVTGYVPSAGAVYLGSRRVDHLPPHRRASRGLVRTWQAAELFDQLTVGENLLASTPFSLRNAARRRAVDDDGSGTRTYDEVVELLGLRELVDAMPSEISLGQQKLVGLARALVCRPTVLLMDEPAAGLDTAETRQLAVALSQLKGHTSVLLIDHDVEMVLSLADRVYVLDFGRLIAAGTPAQIRGNPDVIRAYLGDPDPSTMEQRQP